MTEVEFAAGLSVRSGATGDDIVSTRSALIEEGVPAKLVAKDATLWGPDAESEASIRLGWIDTMQRSRALLPQLAELSAELGDLDHVVLAGMGGSSLAPEVISRTLGRPLTVLDTTDPGQVRAALRDRLERTVVVVSSKSGSTVETDSHRRAYWQAFLDAGMTEAEAGRRFVVVTDPGSPLEQTARDMGAYVVLADPNVGGRYSALTAFGLVPTALAGVDVAALLDEADSLYTSLSENDGNPALTLGALLGTAAREGRDKVALAEDGSGIVGLGDWAEQLIAESTGKHGKGILPVVVESADAPGFLGDDVVSVLVGGAADLSTPPPGDAVAVNGPLGAQFLAWEYATAVAGKVIGINPFDQPNVTESKENTKKILESGAPAVAATFSDGPVTGYCPDDAVTDLDQALSWLAAQAGETGYIAVMAYLDRHGDADTAQVRALLAKASNRPVTFGWGPRFLHSTGQFHKGGPQVGAYLQITGAVTDDLDVPGKSYTFGQLQAAQAAGDRQALTGRDRPLLHLHLTDRAVGITRLLDAARKLGA
jgi:glucose-6-phosphate isomerase